MKISTTPSLTPTTIEFGSGGDRPRNAVLAVVNGYLRLTLIFHRVIIKNIEEPTHYNTIINKLAKTRCKNLAIVELALCALNRLGSSPDLGSSKL